jgi:D-ribose pyranose/furanose isomerase RbsD
MTIQTPEKPENSFRVTLELQDKEPRLDLVLLKALANQEENIEFKNISKTQFKKLFTDKRVLIKGQSAKAKSSVNSGTTFVDILLTTED